MPISRVRPHLRKSPRGRRYRVEAHWRFVPLAEPMLATVHDTKRHLAEARKLGFYAYTIVGDPSKIVIVNYRHHLPDEVVTSLSHETLHNALARVGEEDASRMIDARRNPELLHIYLNKRRKFYGTTGLFKYVPKNQRKGRAFAPDREW